MAMGASINGKLIHQAGEEPDEPAGAALAQGAKA
jgi:hypothetical protein